MARRFLTSSCVLTAGLVIGFGVPRPGWAERWVAKIAPGAARTHADASDAPASVAAAAATLDPAPPGRDGAESTELRQLRAAEDAMFPELPANTKPVTRMRQDGHRICGFGDDAIECKKDELPTDPGDTGDSDWMVGLRMPEIQVKADSRVERFVRYFTQSTQGRKIFRAWLKRSGRYRATVATALRDHYLPQDLHALVMVESGYSPSAVSTAGATGLWQLMPETGRVYGLAVEEDYDERRDPEKATSAATKLLSDLYVKFGSWELTLAAYDMGYKALVNRVRDLASNDFWTMASIEGALPREAVLYVPKVLAAMLILKNLDRYGFDDTHIDGPAAVSDLEVPPGVDLATVARASGTSLQVIRQLNPEMLSDYVPDRGNKFLVHIPGAGAGRANQMLAALLDRRSRDGLEDDAPADFDWGRDDVPPSGAHRGRQARGEYDPFGAGGRGGRDRDDSDDRRSASSRFLDDGGDERAPAADDIGADREVVFYRVGENETINTISRAFGARADDIIDDNHLDPAARLQKGMVLKLRVPHAAMRRMARKRADTRLDEQEMADAPRDRDSAVATRDDRRRGDDRTASDGGDMLDAFAMALGDKPRTRRGGVYRLDRPRTTPPPPATHPHGKRHERNDDP